MLSDIGKNRIHRFLQRFGIRVTSSTENKFSYDRENFDVGEAPVIFDIGANIGQSALWFKSSFPKATIHSFEPFPAIYAELRKNVTNPCYNFAFGPSDGVIDAPDISNPYQQTASLRHGGSTPITVRTIDRFCEEKGITEIDILKTDTEGYEIEVLTGAKRMLGSITYILAEATLISDKHTDLFDLHELLSSTHTLISILDGHHAQNGSGLKYCNALFRKTDRG